MKAFIILLLSPAPLLAQTWIDQYVVGQNRNDVVYEGVYYSPGNCTWDDGTDFTFDFSGIEFPTGIALALVVDESDPIGTALMNGWVPVNVGDSTTFTPETTGLGISAASGPATIHFHIRAVGTPTVAGEFYPCWVDAAVTEASCGNTFSLMAGESFAPCSVAVATGTLEVDEPPFTLIALNDQIIVHTIGAGTLELMDITGRILYSSPMGRSETRMIPASKGGIIIARYSTSSEAFTKKIFIY